VRRRRQRTINQSIEPAVGDTDGATPTNNQSINQSNEVAGGATLTNKQSINRTRGGCRGDADKQTINQPIKRPVAVDADKQTINQSINQSNTAHTHTLTHEGTVAQLPHLTPN